MIQLENKKNFLPKKCNINHQTYFYNFEALKLKKIKKYEKEILKVTEDFSTDSHPHQDPDPQPDLLVRGTDLRIQIRIRIRTKMLRIRNTGFFRKPFRGFS